MNQQRRGDRDVWLGGGSPVVEAPAEQKPLKR